MTKQPTAFNRAGYIATIRATKIKETEGLNILVFLAEKCAEDLTVPVRKFKSEAVAKSTGTTKILALRRIRILKSKGLLKSKPGRLCHWQLPTETELRLFA
jgi:DNA-binding IscR family transcriptional regulator